MNKQVITIPGYELSTYISSLIYGIRKQLLIFLGISLLVHVIPIISNLKFEKVVEEKKRPPTTVKFIQRAPRLQKNLDLQKTPKIVERTMQRRSTPQRMSTMPRTMTTSSTHGGTTLGSLAKPGEFVDRTFSSQQQFYGPNINAEIVNTRGASQAGGNLTDNLIDYTNYRDRFEVLLKQGANKKDISGNLNFYQLQYRGSKMDENGEPGWNVVPQALPALEEYAESKTKLNITLKGAIRLDSKELMDVGLIYMMGSQTEPLYTKEEVRNLERYLRAGGFIFIDDGYAAKWASFNQKTRQMIEEALGYDAEWEKIPESHWLFHCWEDFAGPPPGEDEVRPNNNHPVKERYRYLEGIFLNGRLAVLLSSKGYCKAWGAWPRNPSSNGGPLDNTRQLQFGLNVVVFANTQKGSINEQNWRKLAAEQE